MILGFEANIGLIYYRPKWSWVEMVVGRNNHGPKWLWAEMTRNPHAPAQSGALLLFKARTVHVSPPKFQTLAACLCSYFG